MDETRAMDCDNNHNIDASRPRPAHGEKGRINHTVVRGSMRRRLRHHMHTRHGETTGKNKHCFGGDLRVNRVLKVATRRRASCRHYIVNWLHDNPESATRETAVGCPSAIQVLLNALSLDIQLFFAASGSVCFLVSSGLRSFLYRGRNSKGMAFGAFQFVLVGGRRSALALCSAVSCTLPKCIL